MSDEGTKTKTPDGETAEGEGLPAPDAIAQPEDSAIEESASPTNLGAMKYVHTAFVVVSIAAAFVSGRVLAGIWNALAAWPPAVHVLPQLLLLGEDERVGPAMVAGAVIGLLVWVQLLRNDGVRKWSDDVAAELAKVVWPSRETVTNGTIVVIVASALATVYVGLLDRLWSFLTERLYGA